MDLISVLQLLYVFFAFSDITMKSSAWPIGSFSVPKVKDVACPADFVMGYMSHGTSYAYLSDPYNAEGAYTADRLEHFFCTKTTDTPQSNAITVQNVALLCRHVELRLHRISTSH